jgi:tetratricopeptide (TPR) repeat protein
LGVAVLFEATAPAAADDRETCRTADGRMSITACTDAIASGKFRERDLAALYLNRGLAASKLNDPIDAIRDYSEAIKVDPNYAIALSNRCAIYVRT